MANENYVNPNKDFFKKDNSGLNNGQNKSPSENINPVLDKVIQSLLDKSNLISSQDTQLEKKIGEIKTGIEKGQEASAQRIESAYNREKGYVAEKGARTLVTAKESQRGFATNRALLGQIEEETNKNLKDLEQRKQELLLAGQADAAEKITNLQLKELEYAQTSRQQAFTNMLSIANIGLQVKQQQGIEERFKQTEQRLTTQFEQTRKDNLAKLAIQYGVEINPEDSLADAIKKIAPVAKKYQDAKLAKMLADVKTAQQDFEVGQKADYNLRQYISGQVTDEDGNVIRNDPVSAADAIYAEWKKIGIKVDNKDYEDLVRRAWYIQDIIDSENRAAKAETDNEMLKAEKTISSVTNPFAGAGSAAINKQAQGTQSPFAGLKTSSLQAMTQEEFNKASEAFLSNLYNTK